MHLLCTRLGVGAITRAPAFLPLQSNIQSQRLKNSSAQTHKEWVLNPDEGEAGDSSSQRAELKHGDVKENDALEDS